MNGAAVTPGAALSTAAGPVAGCPVSMTASCSIAQGVSRYASGVRETGSVAVSVQAIITELLRRIQWWSRVKPELRQSEAQGPSCTRPRA